MLITGAVEDARVPFWHPLSYTAKLRRTATNNPNLFLEITDEYGHFGNPGEHGTLSDAATELSFLVSSVAN